MKRSLQKLGTHFALFIYGIILSAFVLGLFFYQTVGGANIWEFFLAAAPFLSLLLSLHVALLVEKKSWLLRSIVLSVIIIIIIPQWLLTVRSYIQDEYFSGFHGVSQDQVASFAYIATKTPKTSLIFLANQPVYSYASVANLFVDRDLYLSGNGVRQIVTDEMAKRRMETLTVTQSTRSSDISQILHTEHISYLYYYGHPANMDALLNAHLHIVFINRAATIFQVQ